MDPSHYLRVLKLRWKLIAVFTLLGAAAGLGLTWLDGRNVVEPPTYWVANHKLIVTTEAAESGRFPNLLQTALLVTGGDVPVAVAEMYDTDETGLTKRIRTVADNELAVIEISAVGTVADDAAALADDFTAELLSFLSERDNQAWNEEIALAEEEAELQSQRLEVVDGRRRSLSAQISQMEQAAAELNSAQGTDDLQGVRQELSAVEIEWASAAALYAETLATLDTLRRRGAPVQLFTTLDIIPPYKISESEYFQRLSQGRQGYNNFSKATITNGSSSGFDLREKVSNPVVGTALGALLALTLSLGVAMIHLRIDPRLRTKTQVEKAFDLPVLSEIPAFSQKDTDEFELHAVTRRRSAVTEAYRVVRSALLFARSVNDFSDLIGTDPALGTPSINNDSGVEVVHGSETRVIMITSPGPSEGKTTTTANLAVLLGEAGYQVLVINCDYRIPKLHRYFGQPHTTRRTLDTGVPGVTLVADVADPGAENPTAVVDAQRKLIRKARDRYDVVLLDTAPLLATNDALSLLPAVDLVLVVAAEGKTDREAAAESIDLLRRRQANVAGVVLTGSSGFGRTRYYYKYRYGSYYDTDGDAKMPAPPRTSRIRGKSARATVSSN